MSTVYTQRLGLVRVEGPGERDLIVGSTTQTTVIIDVAFANLGDAPGTLQLYIFTPGDRAYLMIATAVAPLSDRVWQGTQVLNGGDVLRIYSTCVDWSCVASGWQLGSP